MLLWLSSNIPQRKGSDTILLLHFPVMSFKAFSWFTSYFLVIFLICCSSSTVEKTDEHSLLALKDQIQGGLSSWNQSVHFCQWQGITCNKLHPQRIIELNLSSQSLVGSISPHIGNLSFLQSLNLENNKFHGKIPQEIGQLFRLHYLNMANNTLQGEIPMNLTQCADLVEIHLGENNLTRSIPVELGSLPRLSFLDLSKNNLIGEIPASFGNLSALESLYIGMNSLEGSIPETLGRLSSLSVFVVNFNKLSGQVPSSIYNLSSITEFWIGGNQLNGSLPPDLGITFPNLQFFAASGNWQLSGPFPLSLTNATKLEFFDVIANSLTGKVPDDLGALQNLSWLDFSKNNLGSGEAGDFSFITSLANASNLKMLSVSYNNFGGALPVSLSNFSANIETLYLGYNPIVGTIPEGIGNLVNLIALGLNTAHFQGSIPSSIGNIHKLQKLLLSENELTGLIPPSLANLTYLFQLHLSDNRLQGNIPSELGGYQYLKDLALSQNKLNGTIPKQIFNISSLSENLDFSLNSFTGSLPSDVGNLRNLRVMDISGNKLSGEVPSTLGNCISIEELYLENNLFEGTFPQSLTSLKGVREIDVSSNNLSGKIPKYFEEFLYLERLNLSFNNLEGEVPKNGVFENASAISVDGNIKLCGGIIELHLQTCRIHRSTKKGRSLALIIVISMGITFSLLVLFTFLVFYMKKKAQSDPSVSLTITQGDSSLASLRDLYRKVSYKELLQATGGFSLDNLIGSGGFGRVYKGILDQGKTVVAVKVFNLQQKGSLKSFKAECKSLRHIRHRNLVKIITSCSSTDYEGIDFKALVFEFMPNGSLETWLHPVGDGKEYQSRKLNLFQRLNIATDVASALKYLHHQCHIPIIHRDLKPSNVLLNNDMVAHVGDFGLAKLLPESMDYLYGNQSTSIGVKGSIGYVPPEYGMGGAASTQGDVYSYGILLLELFTGRRPTDEMFKESLNIHNFAKSALPNRVEEIVDPVLVSEEQQEEEVAAMQKCIASVVRIGVACSVQSPGERMNMEEVENELHSIRDQFLAFLDRNQE